MKKLVLIIAALAVLGAAAWLGLRSKPAPTEQVAAATTAVATEAPAPESTGRTPRIFRHRDQSKSDGTSADPMEIWDKRVDAILESKGTDTEIADKLLELYPQVPTNGQADLILEIAPRVANTNYNRLSNLLTNSSSPEEVIETLLTDLIDRPDNVRLPLMLEMARSKENPKSEDAHDLLEVILGDDYGEDWELWSKKISEWIASHPE